MSARYLSQRFAQELTAWSGTDKLPQSANQDVRYGLELQAKRMKDRGLLSFCRRKIGMPGFTGSRILGWESVRAVNMNHAWSLSITFG